MCFLVVCIVISNFKELSIFKVVQIYLESVHIDFIRIGGQYSMNVLASVVNIQTPGPISDGTRGQVIR